MKHIDTWIHDNYYKQLENKAKKMGETKYKAAQLLIEKGLQEEREREISLTLAYWYLCYSLIVSAIILLI